MIALVDYGAGNLTSVRKAMAAVGAEFFTPAAAADLDRADAIIVPGVGHFSATARLDEPWRAAIRRALERGRPLFGICVGMQWLFDGSTEAPDLPGLGVLPGTVRRLSGIVPGSTETLKVPHVGWNSLHLVRPSRLLAKVPEGTQVYFTHSYAAPLGEATVAETTHGETFAAAVESGLVGGVQFHPEKSHDAGLEVLRAFVARAAR